MSNSTRTNNLYFLKLWIPAFLLLGLLLLAVGGAIISGWLAQSVPMALGFIIFVMFLIVTRNLEKHRFAKMLLQSDPTPIVEHYRLKIGRLPNGDCLAASMASVILALYGKTEEANRVLQSVSWKDVSPFIDAQRLNAAAIIKYIEGDPGKGLESAKSALCQSEAASITPGIKTSNIAFQTCCNLGLVLCAEESAETQKALQTAMSRLPLLGSLIAAWGLAILAKRQDDKPACNRFRQYIVEHAPNFSPVIRGIDMV